MNRTHRLLVAAGALSVVLTVALLVTPLRWAYEAPDLRITLETAQALIAALVAFLVYGLHRRTARSTDLAVVYSFGMSAATNLFFALARGDSHPAADSADGRFQTWAPLLLRVVSAAALGWAAMATPQRVRLRRPGLAVSGAIVGTAAIALALAAVFADQLPRGVTLEPSNASQPDLDGPAPVLAMQLVLMVMFAIAAWGFARRATNDEPLLQALAAGCVLAAVARLHFFLYPSLYSDVVHIGDIVRLGFYAVLLGGAAQQIVLYWRAEADAAAADERRRMARELHDGLTQELSFIRSQTRGYDPDRSHPEALHHVAEAADRAVTEARRLLGVLTSSSNPGNLEDVLRASAASVGYRSGVVVDVRVADGTNVPAHAYEDLARVVAQATSNAAKHGDATRVVIEVRPGTRGDVVTIHDDGAGFDPERIGSGGHGLTSMRERVQGLGGELRIDSDAVTGTRLEFELPRA